MEENSFERLIDAAGLTGKEVEEMFEEFARSNPYMESEMSSEVATLDSCVRAVQWIKSKLDNDKWRSMTSLLFIIALTLTEAPGTNCSHTNHVKETEKEEEPGLVRSVTSPGEMANFKDK